MTRQVITGKSELYDNFDFYNLYPYIAQPLSGLRSNKHMIKPSNAYDVSNMDVANLDLTVLLNLG